MSFRDILFLRDSRNMTQEQLAMLLGVIRQAVSKWEAGAFTSDMDRLVRLCEIFEVDLDELIRGDVTTAHVNRALAVPVDAPQTDVTGYDPHMRARVLFIAAAVTLVAAVGSLFFALSAWSQILIWGVIAIAVGWAFFTVFREA